MKGVAPLIPGLSASLSLSLALLGGVGGGGGGFCVYGAGGGEGGGALLFWSPFVYLHLSENTVRTAPANNW